MCFGWYFNKKRENSGCYIELGISSRIQTRDLEQIFLCIETFLSILNNSNHIKKFKFTSNLFLKIYSVVNLDYLETTNVRTSAMYTFWNEFKTKWKFKDFTKKDLDLENWNQCQLWWENQNSLKFLMVKDVSVLFREIVKS